MTPSEIEKEEAIVLTVSQKEIRQLLKGLDIIKPHNNKRTDK